MRSDKQLNPRFVGSERWTHDRGPGGQVTNVIRNPDGSENVWTAFSHSGKERNQMFMNQGGGGFANVSGVSGTDSVLDGRSFVIWDFNRDGKSDLAVVNANGSLLQVFRNQSPEKHGVVGIRLEGTKSNRDAIGARIEVTTDRGTIMRVLSCGEGFAAQNSRTILFGLGKSNRIEKVIVTWPSGRKSEFDGVDSGDLAIVREGRDTVDIKRMQN